MPGVPAPTLVCPAAAWPGLVATLRTPSRRAFNWSEMLIHRSKSCSQRSTHAVVPVVMTPTTLSHPRQGLVFWRDDLDVDSQSIAVPTACIPVAATSAEFADVFPRDALFVRPVTGAGCVSSTYSSDPTTSSRNTGSW